MDRRIALGVAISLAVFGCGPNARSVFDKIQEAACAGDADKFFVYVANDQETDNWLAAVGTLEQRAACSTDLGRELCREENKKHLIAELGKDGSFCGETFVSSEKIEGRERVEVRNKKGSKRYWYFAQVGGQLKVVEFKDPTGSAGHDVSATTALDVCHQLEAVGAAESCKRDPQQGDAATFAISSNLGEVLHYTDDLSYGAALGVTRGQWTASNKARVIVFYTSATPADVQAKAKAVVDGLGAAASKASSSPVLQAAQDATPALTFGKPSALKVTSLGQTRMMTFAVEATNATNGDFKLCSVTATFKKGDTILGTAVGNAIDLKSGATKTLSMIGQDDVTGYDTLKLEASTCL